jgi:hypothetical protein
MGKRKARRQEGVRRSVSLSSASEQKSRANIEVEPTNLSQLVREVLKDMGDPNARAPEVKARAIELFPAWKKDIEGASYWSSYVTQSRNKVAEELGIARVVKTGGGGTPNRGTLAFSDYENANEFVKKFCDGDTSKALELLDWIAGKNSTRLRVAMKAWSELVESVGSPEAALKALETLSTTGGVITR